MGMKAKEVALRRAFIILIDLKQQCLAKGALANILGTRDRMQLRRLDRAGFEASRQLRLTSQAQESSATVR